ncbi:ribonuclease H [Senna tora]|uniref:Ribonuclease H n=1 Tax=Senna tora TaxID=362788 RepID=A0A834TR53_9FABA|nr:ribonuclease H [Senna tora]
MGYPNYEKNEVRGYAGGVWALWNKEIKATCSYNHEQFLQFEILDREKGCWNLFAIYANPHAHIRDNLWPLIESRCTNNVPSLLAGDFNEIASITEQRGGSPPNLQRCNKFQAWINECGLIDMIPAGPFFTWEGPKRLGQGKLYKRLDRVLCNQNWRTTFSDASSRCLTRINSDHHPLLVSMEEIGANTQNRPFRFENCWMQHEDFTAFFKQEWNQTSDLNTKILKLQNSLKTWNKDVFGDISKKKKRLLNRINGIQVAIDKKLNPFLEDLGRKLAKELEMVLNQEEALWFQKARCQWIRDGDRNTRYYHTKTISHRRKNKILMLKDRDGNWTEDLDEIKKIIINFYKELFKEGPVQRSSCHPDIGDPLSPYIFVLCMDILSHIICNAVNDGSWKGIKAGKDNIYMSHLMFADDLLLFGSATVSQARVIIKCLDQFCLLTGFKRSQEIGKYLGAEIIHGRKTKFKFNHIIDKIQNRLAGWKANCLSLAGRATLVQSVCASMPLYHMQNCMLPKSVINQIEKMERAFLWGSTSEKKRCHQIGWDKVCTLKSSGGLGILSLRDMNVAFFYKLAWQLITRKDSLWVNFIKGRYGVSENFIFESRSKPTDSSFWKDITRALPDLRNHIAWELGDGSKISFWDDMWVSNDMTLRQYVISSNTHVNKDDKVKDFTNDHEQWDIEKLTGVLTQPAINKIMCIVPPTRQADPDVPMWNLGKDSTFTTKSAYLCIRGLTSNNGVQGWGSIWKGCFQQRHKVLLWRLGHNSLPTRSRTASWSGASPLCPLCKVSRESNLHAFRDCSFASRIWNSFINRKDRALFFMLPLKDWIFWNTHRKSKFCDIPWISVFATIYYCLWDWRNRLVNEAEFAHPNEPHRVILNIAKSLWSAWNTSATPRLPCGHDSVLDWEKPVEGWVKVNTDGAVCRESNLGGCGGIIRDSKGDWIKGFTRRIGMSNPVFAELWSIAEGLQLAWESGFRRVILENDYQEAIKCLQINPHVNPWSHPAVNIVKSLLSKDWELKIKHIPRSANKCADLLAKSSLSCNSKSVILDCIPDFVRDAVRFDALGSSSPRDPGG